MNYLLIPLDEAIVFPTVTATLPIDVGEEERVFLIPRRDGEYGRVGVVAEVIEHGVSRRGNPVNPFYFAESDGCIKLAKWKVFWYGIDGFDAIERCVMHCRDRAPTLVD